MKKEEMQAFVESIDDADDAKVLLEVMLESFSDGVVYDFVNQARLRLEVLLDKTDHEEAYEAGMIETTITQLKACEKAIDTVGSRLGWM
jgi:hypothetical protein